MFAYAFFLQPITITITMMEPKHIVAGKTYDVLFGDEPLTVLITGRAETGPDNYLWRGTILTTGQTTRICNPNRFVWETMPAPSGMPWMLTLDVRKEELEQKSFALEWFSVSIRERDTLRLLADMPNIPAEIFPHCAEVIRNAIRICRGGPTGSDVDRLHFFEEDDKYLHGVSVDLAFDLWEPAYASDDYFKALFQRILDAGRNFGKNPTIKDDFQANPDGVGAVYWTEKDGVVKVLWPDHPFLKTAFLQSEKVVTDFAESLFGEHDHSFETLRKLLDSHEGEWFDPPENIELFDTYRAERFDSGNTTAGSSLANARLPARRSRTGRRIKTKSGSVSITKRTIRNTSVRSITTWRRLKRRIVNFSGERSAGRIMGHPLRGSA